MNKQERIEKMANDGRDELIAGNYQGRNDIERLSKALHKLGYINGADFVKRLKELKVNFCLTQDCADRFDETINKALQEYLK